MGHREILGHLRRMWRPFQLESVIMNEGGLYFLNFNSKEGIMNVIEKGPWLVDQKPLFVQRWEAGLCLSKAEPKKIPLWVKIFNIPLEAWNFESIIDVDNALIKSIEIYYKSLGKSMMLDVEYAWRPPSCSHCKVFGHCFKKCKIRTRTEEEIIKMNEKKFMNEK
ncbi:RNA-directed DNA polymerase, eukaryota, reverse transcriptase zinc-binding domain protein [Tanacetum coccineum]